MWHCEKKWFVKRKDELKSMNMAICTVMAIQRKTYKQNRSTARDATSCEFNIEMVSIGRIGQTKRLAAAYAKMICQEF